MNKTVTQVRFPKVPLPQLKKVAAYARVSTGKDAMLHSLAAQVSHYAQLIQGHSGWQYVGVYADEALSGTKDGRQNFQRLIADCRAGKIDMVITKSISRFARNTVTLLQTVRDLKSLGVDVYFEEQNIHTMSADGELLLTILASYAQEESLSASENQKWRVRHSFQQGLLCGGKMIGYRYDQGSLSLHAAEAQIVRKIYELYLSGMGLEAIAKQLNKDGHLTRNGHRWISNSVLAVLRNYAYTGNLFLQTTYRENHLTKRKRQNNGKLPKYHITDSHEPIVSLQQFNAVQEELHRRAEKHTHPGEKKKHYPFTGMIRCGCCGKNYRRKTTPSRVTWVCQTYNRYGKAACPSKQIPEDTLIAVTEEVVGSLDTLDSKITEIRAENGNILMFTLSDGTVSVKRWTDRSRADSWTPQMKENARQRELERRSSLG